MKINILQVAYKADITGGEKVVYELACSLQAKGIGVICVVPGEGPLAEELRVRGIEVAIIPIRKTYDIPAMVKLARFMRQHDVTLLHTHGMMINIVGRIAARLARVPLVVSSVHLTRELAGTGRARNLYEKVLNVYYRILDNITSRLNRVIVAVSGAVKDDLVKQGVQENKIIVIRNGIPVPARIPSRAEIEAKKKETGIPPHVRVVGTIARLSRQKNIEVLIHAVPTVLRTYPDTVFLIIGDGYERERLQELVTRLNLDHAVKFLGYRSDARDILYVMELFVLPSLWEGLPLVVLEAMAAARPVVATDIPGTREAVIDGKTGILVPPNDIVRFSEGILRLLGNKKEAVHMGREGYDRVISEFTLARMSEETIGLYERLHQSWYRLK